MWKKIYTWLEIRFGLDDLAMKRRESFRVPKNVSLWQTLGLVTIVAFVIQAVTGFSLLLYYTPHPDHAFDSIQQVIMNNTPYGWLFRMMHVVGSNLIVVLVFLHLLSVFFMGSYKKPRGAGGRSGQTRT